jgi:deoxyadenosine/deoxycytidine kinase
VTTSLRHLVISGNTGCGKSTLLAAVSSALGAPAADRSVTVVDESELHHPAMGQMFVEPGRWALPIQLNFLAQRVTRLLAVDTDRVVIERCLDEDALFFRYYLETGAIPAALDACYTEILEELKLRAPAPDLIVHLRAPPDFIVQRLAKQSSERDPEAQPAAQELHGYVSALNALYDEWSVRGPTLARDYRELDVSDPSYDATALAAELVRAL